MTLRLMSPVLAMSLNSFEEEPSRVDSVCGPVKAERLAE
jgi:hypothetical protein